MWFWTMQEQKNTDKLDWVIRANVLSNYFDFLSYFFQSLIDHITSRIFSICNSKFDIFFFRAWSAVWMISCSFCSLGDTDRTLLLLRISPWCLDNIISTWPSSSKADWFFFHILSAPLMTAWERSSTTPSNPNNEEIKHILGLLCKVILRETDSQYAKQAWFIIEWNFR